MIRRGSSNSLNIYPPKIQGSKGNGLNQKRPRNHPLEDLRFVYLFVWFSLQPSGWGLKDDIRSVMGNKESTSSLNMWNIVGMNN